VCAWPLSTEYRLVAKKGEGTFSEVLKAQAIKNGKYVAIKCMKNHFDSLDQVRPRERGAKQPIAFRNQHS
jgi:serine/threonine protein kinase